MKTNGKPTEKSKQVKGKRKTEGKPEAARGSQKPSEAARSSQTQPGSSREQPEAARSSQEQPRAIHPQKTSKNWTPKPFKNIAFRQKSTKNNRFSIHFERTRPGNSRNYYRLSDEQKKRTPKQYKLLAFRARRKNSTPKQYKLLAFRDPESRPSQNHCVLYHFLYQKFTSKKIKKLNAKTIVKHSVSATVLRKQYFLLSFRACKKKWLRNNINC